MKQKIKNGELFTEAHRKHLSEAAMGNHNFGSGDTRSIGCYCIDSIGIEHHFHSYRDAWNGGKIQIMFLIQIRSVYSKER